MWCPTCRADVAAELSADSQRFLCTRCQTDLGLAAPALRTPAARPIEAERDARELLARWSSQNLLEPPVPPTVLADGVLPPKNAPAAKQLESDTRPLRQRRRRRSLRESPRATRDRQALRERPGSWLSAIGHVAAYAGIGLLTCGSVLVVWSHFGGPASYAPTGWLVSTLGQMLLFLGVVTLVSGGLEQNASEVKRQILQVHERLRRMERGHGSPAEGGPQPRRRRSSQSRAA
uniref:Uncharacterized protein n=1 Tax=Schlesneria paludicola TaxID=360056 RepID=A0A7C2K1I0_9PLAN